MSASGHHRCCCVACTPLLEWLFDEGSGTTVHDTSGSGYNGTLVGSYTWLADGIHFDSFGAAGTSSVSLLAGRTVWSISAALRMTSSASSVRGVFGVASQPIVGIGKDKVNSTADATFDTIDSDVWASYVLTCDGLDRRLYRNTTLLRTIAGSSTTPPASAIAFYVGYNNATPNMDAARARFWGCVLGAAALQTLADEAALL